MYVAFWVHPKTIFLLNKGRASIVIITIIIFVEWMFVQDK